MFENINVHYVQRSSQTQLSSHQSQFTGSNLPWLPPPDLYQIEVLLINAYRYRLVAALCGLLRGNFMYVSDAHAV